MFRRMLRAGALLGGFAVLGSTLVALTWEHTHARIESNRRAALLQDLNELIPASDHDNDLFTDITTVVDADLLGTPAPVTTYRARRNGSPTAAILTPVAPDGYGGAIRLLVAIRTDGTLAGVRVSEHHETPGLGDAIEASRSDWIKGFRGRSLGDPDPEQWAVRRDGGIFDQFTGATITPRAVVKAVKNALLYFEDHRDELFTPLPTEDSDHRP